jgi:hypothetical protein
MTQLSYPGVYIREIPSGVRTITGVATSITAFVGRAKRGPVDKPTTITSYAEFERLFGGVWSESTLGHAVRDFYRLGGSIAIIVRVHRTGTNDTASITLGPAGNTRIVLDAASAGLWGSKLSATIDHNVSSSVDATHFNLTINDAGTGSSEVFRNISFSSTSSRPADLILKQQSRLVEVATMPTALPPAVTASAANGTDGQAVNASVYTTAANMQTNKKGVYALEDADLFNLLVIPPYTAGGDIDTQVRDHAISYVEDRRAVMILDPPPGWTTRAAAVTGVGGAGFPSSENAAIYFPRIRQSDPTKDGELGTFAPSGAVAGVIARTDGTRGVWKAPAGLDATLAGVSELAVKLTDLDIGLLNPLGVNCLKVAPTAGHVIWGARTRDGADQQASEWKYLPVRRTALFIEESLYRGTQWVVFEPNDEPLWSQIRLNVGAFMNSLFRQGAFAGTKANDAYFVKCDSETTTQDDVNQGIVNIHVGFAPLKPAEFVVISIQQIAGQTGGA